MGSGVAIGVDTHRDVHVAVALDRLGGMVDSLEVAADAEGYQRLWQWACELGGSVFAVEGTGSYGAGLSAFLAAAGCEVFECERPRRRDRRQGKSVVRARTAALNELQAVIVTAPEILRTRFRGLNGKQAAKAALRLRERRPETAVPGAVLRRIALRVRHLSIEIDELDQQLQTITSELVPDLLAESGVGPVCAAQLVVSSGDPSRMVSEASFAALAGTSPVEASSGQTRRHRLNRGGDRQLNRALHVIALNRTRRHPPTVAYYQRLINDGKTPREARRCVKRQLARYFHHRLQASPNLALTP